MLTLGPREIGKLRLILLDDGRCGTGLVVHAIHDGEARGEIEATEGTARQEGE